MSYYGIRYGKDAEELFGMILKYDPEKAVAVRAMNALCRNGIHSVKKLIETDEKEIAGIRNIGLKCLKILGQIRKELGAETVFGDMNLGVYVGHNHLPEFRVAKIPLDIWEKLGDHGDPNEILVHLAEQYLIAYHPYKPKSEVTA